jgi:pimeloyl-ACP methyl ester carboxylesterase
MAECAEIASITGALANAARREDAARLLSRLPVALSLVVGDARVELSSQGPQASASAPLKVWRQCLAPAPPPGFQSVGALVRSGAEFRLVGDPLPVAQCLALLEMLVETAREMLAPAAAAAAAAARPPATDSSSPESSSPEWSGPESSSPESSSPEPSGPGSSGSGSPGSGPPASEEPPVEAESLELIRGRYLQLALPELGKPWVYEESTGSKDLPAMLMLHTAGADSRQWHALMTDRRLFQDWRILAFDMPFHGRSSPPLQWNGAPWRLDTRTYLETIDAYLDAVGIERALIVGCSMGAAAGLAYLAERPARALGAIQLEAPFRAAGRRSEYLDHPAVHAGRFSAAWVKALLSPTSSAARRRRASWIYTQAGPGVYEADLGFYSDDFDAALYLDRIDTRRSPLWLLTGEYDYSATPADGRRIADAIQGAHFETMPGLGHFPMTENPAALMTHLHPITSALAGTIGTRGNKETRFDDEQ